MATNKTVVGYEKKSGGGRTIPAKSQTESAGGNKGGNDRKFTQAPVQEDDALQGGQVYSLDGLDEIGKHTSALGGLSGVKRVGSLKPNKSGGQNLFAGNAGATGLNSQHSWSKNSGSQNAY